MTSSHVTASLKDADTHGCLQAAETLPEPKLAPQLKTPFRTHIWDSTTSRPQGHHVPSLISFGLRLREIQSHPEIYQPSEETSVWLSREKAARSRRGGRLARAGRWPACGLFQSSGLFIAPSPSRRLASHLSASD